MGAKAVFPEDFIACPRCRGGLLFGLDTLSCRSQGCSFRGLISEGIFILTEAEVGRSFFDAKLQVMRDNTSQIGTRAMFYVQQVEAMRPYLVGSRVVLDIGCGAALPYERQEVGCVIGLDVSYESLRENRDVDLRLYASATRLPIPDQAVDTIVCFYCLHHFVGASVRENYLNLRAAFAEFGRVLKPGGDLVVFEVAPWRPAWWVQVGTWNLARKVLRGSLDMFFWSRPVIEQVSREQLPPGARFDCRAFRVPALTVFPLIFSLPRLRVPRFLYPFEACLYHWGIGK